MLLSSAWSNTAPGGFYPRRPGYQAIAPPMGHFQPADQPGLRRLSLVGCRAVRFRGALPCLRLPRRRLRGNLEVACLVRIRLQSEYTGLQPGHTGCSLEATRLCVVEGPLRLLRRLPVTLGLDLDGACVLLRLPACVRGCKGVQGGPRGGKMSASSSACLRCARVASRVAAVPSLAWLSSAPAWYVHGMCMVCGGYSIYQHPWPGCSTRVSAHLLQRRQLPLRLLVRCGRLMV